MPETARKELEKSAKKLSELVGIPDYKHVEIPLAFLDKSEDIEGLYDEVVKPQWNHFAGLLADGEGYLGLLALKANLANKVKQLEAQCEQNQIVLNRFEMMAELLKSELKRFGQNSKVGKSLEEVQLESK